MIRTARNIVCLLIGMTISFFVVMAYADCLPKEAGGPGIGFVHKAMPDGGLVIAWFCPASRFTWTPETIAARPSWKPALPADMNALAAELSRLRVMGGYDRGAGTYLKPETQALIDSVATP